MKTRWYQSECVSVRLYAVFIVKSYWRVQRSLKSPESDTVSRLMMCCPVSWLFETHYMSSLHTEIDGSCLLAWSNRARNLADILTRCSGLLQGERGSQYEGYPFIATHKSSLGVTRSHALPPEVAVCSLVDRSLHTVEASIHSKYDIVTGCRNAS